MNVGGKCKVCVGRLQFQGLSPLESLGCMKVCVWGGACGLDTHTTWPSGGNGVLGWVVGSVGNVRSVEAGQCVFVGSHANTAWPSDAK